MNLPPPHTGALTHSPSLQATPSPSPTPRYIPTSIYMPPSDFRACARPVDGIPSPHTVTSPKLPPSHFLWHHFLSCIDLYTSLSSPVHVVEPLNEEKRPSFSPVPGRVLVMG